MLGVPFVGSLVTIMRIKILKIFCTYPVKAVIKEIGKDVGIEGGATTYYQVLEFEHYGGTHTVRGISSVNYMELGTAGDIVELLIDPNDGEKFVVVTNSDEGVMTVFTIAFGIMFIAANYFMISAMK